MTERMFYRRKAVALASLARLRMDCWPRNAKRRLILLAELVHGRDR